MKYRSIFIICALLCLATPFINTGSAENFRVMLYTESFPPYSFKKDDSRTGIVQDLFKALGKETGDTFEFVHVPFKRAQHKFDVGQIDIEPMCNPAWRKSSTVDAAYTIPFAVSEEILLFNADKYRPVNTPEKLLGQTIGTVSGFMYPAFEPYFSDGRITPYPMHDEHKLIQMLLAGRLDQALMNKDFAQYEMKISRLRDKLTVSAPCNSLDMMMRFHPGKSAAVPRFNKVLRKFLKDGTIKRIYDCYR